MKRSRTYNVRLRATDAAGLHVDTEATISILDDINDAPVGITLDNSSFPENQKEGLHCWQSFRN